MNLPLIFQAGVREEIDDAFAWFERQRGGLGEEFLEEVEAVLDHIRLNPELHPPTYRSVRHARVKRFSYAVHYRLEPERVLVIAVHHGRGDPKRWQSRA
jgi:plasmid stabilization system protein ParE